MAEHHDNHEVDAHTGVSTTGHEWDGIRELNTPLPRWWLGIFYATIVWSVGYWVVYPAWPMITGATQGVIGYASRIEIAKDLALLQQHRATQSSGLAEASLEQIKADPSLFRIAMAQGKAAFGDNCAACHGVGGAGSPEPASPLTLVSTVGRAVTKTCRAATERRASVGRKRSNSNQIRPLAALKRRRR